MLVSLLTRWVAAQPRGAIMQLFTRSVMLSGAVADVTAFATDMRSYASGLAGREMSLWSVLFGGPQGSMVFSAHVEGLADLQSVGATLLQDSGYHDRLAAGRGLSAGPAEDRLYTPVYGALGDDHPPVGAMAVITTAVIANGKYAEAIGWGIEIAQYVEGVSGMPMLFLMDDYGDFGRVTWVGVANDAQAADAGSAKINADTGYVERLGAAGALFVPGSGSRGLLARVA